MLSEQTIDRLLIENEKRYESLQYLNEEKGDLSNIVGDFARSAFTGIGTGKVDAVSEFILDMLFDALGFESDTLLGSFFLEISKEFIENVVIRNPQNISKYFGSNGCEYMASDFVVVLGEAGADIMVKSVINHIKKEALIAANSGEGGISSEIYGLLSGSLLGALSDSILVKGLSKVVKEAFQNEMLEKLKPYVKNAICNMELPDLSDIFSDFTGYFGFGEDENETVVA